MSRVREIDLKIVYKGRFGLDQLAWFDVKSLITSSAIDSRQQIKRGGRIRPVWTGVSKIDIKLLP